MKFSLFLIAATVALASAQDAKDELMERKLRMKERMMELREGSYKSSNEVRT